MMKKKIESPFRKLKILVVLPLVAMLFYAFAVPEYQYGSENSATAPQAKTMDVKGQVVKADGSALPGTSVILKGSTLGTISDPKGNFILKGIPSDGELVFSFVGFRTVVQKTSNEPMKIIMEVSKVGIDQITVIGYGTPSPQALSLRGIDDENPPLFFLDGIPITKAAMDKINQETIESISVLKNKSATDIYGERAKNGAILIKTKAKDSKGTGEKSSNEGVVVVGYGKIPSGQNNPPANVALRLIDEANPPLFILDGVPVDKKVVEQMNPSDISSINILKDKSAVEMYGEKGKNGVIQIKTKAKTDYSAGTGIDYSAPKEKQVFVVVEEMPEFPGGEKALRDFIGSNVKYPEDAKKEGIQGRVFVNFVVKSDGTLGNFKVVWGVHPLLDKEALRVLTLLPTWKPGKQRGQAVNVAYTIPIQFAMDGDKMAKQELFPPRPKVPTQRPDGVYIVVEEMPEFPGGFEALRNFIASTVKYPPDALKDGILGKVFVTFTVKADGTVGDAKIARGVHPLLDDEAVRVVNSMPAWKPGKQGGEAVSVSYTVPVQFAIKNGAVQQKPSLVLIGSPKPEKQVFIVVEEMPEFPGGELALRTFIAKAIKYPAEAQKDKIQGKVFVSFVVSSEGKVEQAKVEWSVSPSLDAEAIRVVNSLPDWKPGKQRGTAVSVSYTIPIEFKLN
jgi:TonB family protein